VYAKQLIGIPSSRKMYSCRRANES